MGTKVPTSNVGSLFGVYKLITPDQSVGLAQSSTTGNTANTYSYNINTFPTTGYLGVTKYSVNDYPTSLSNNSTSVDLVAFSLQTTTSNVEINTFYQSVTDNLGGITFNLSIGQIYGNATTNSALDISEIIITSYASIAQRAAIFINQKRFYKTP